MYDPVEREAEAPVREAEFQVLVSKYIENRITNKKKQYFHFLAWSSVPTTVDVRPFIQPVGPKVCIPDSPLDIFSLFFTTAVIQHLVTETNRYAAQLMLRWLRQAMEHRREGDEGLPRFSYPDGDSERAGDSRLLVTK